MDIGIYWSAEEFESKFKILFKNTGHSTDNILNKFLRSSNIHFNPRSKYSQIPLEVLHMDVWDPTPIPTNGNIYYLLTIDEFSRYSWFSPLLNKNQIFPIFESFQTMIERAIGTKIEILQTDSRGEFLNHKFINHCKFFGIQPRFSSSHTP